MPKKSVNSRISSFELYSHRGLALRYPENTLEAFEEALSYGAHWIETDVHSTADGVIVIFHDDTLDRVAGISAEISKMTWAQVQEVELAQGCRIPTLEQALIRFPQAQFNIDVKDSTSARSISSVIARTQSAHSIRIASFNESRRSLSLRGLRNAVPGVPLRSSAAERSMYIFFMMAQLSPRLWSLGQRLGKSFEAGGFEPFDSLQIPPHYEVLGVQVQVLTPHLVRTAHRLGLQVHIWTVDEPSQMRQFIEMGVDGIVTNRIDLLAQVVSEYRQEK